MARMYVYRSGGITTGAIEGTASDLSDASIIFSREKRIREEVDFSPILRAPHNQRFLVGNIYEPEVCTMVVYQDENPGQTKRELSTSVTVHGTTDNIALNLLNDFARVFDFKKIEPSGDLKDNARNASFPLEMLMQTSASLGRKGQLYIFATALGLKQQEYRKEGAMKN